MALDLTAFNHLSDVDDQHSNPDIIKQIRGDESLLTDMPVQFTDLDLWANYTNDKLYYLDIEVRRYLKEARYHREKNNGMRTAAQIVFPYIFGRKSTPEDGQTYRMLHALLTHYCTRKTGSNMINGIRYSHVYYFSKYACKEKRPYSMRLRLEENNSARAFSGKRPGKG